jgi:polyphosphate kinase
VKARFDEELNIQWAEEMENCGIKVHYSFPGLKVHSKIALIKRKEESGINSYCYLGTGNFNENTAKIYTDFGLLTKNEKITKEVEKVFDFLINKNKKSYFENMLVAQFNMRKRFDELIDNEISNAKKGKPAFIKAKMNSLEDKKLIKKLYEASKAGVKIDLLVRGICCLVPGVKGLSDNIKVTSIVGRFLEHSRVYIFCNNKKELVYAGSADLMKRNLSRRIETIFPILDKDIRKNVLRMIDLQLNDNVKARIIDSRQKNKYVKNDSAAINSQTDFYNLLSS